MKKSIFVGAVVATLSLGASFSYADKGTVGGGGGSLTEIQAKGFLNQLADYLSSSEGKEKFPEVVVYDQKHPNETIEQLATDLSPEMTDTPVYFNKVERDCVSNSELAADEKTIVRTMTCNVNKLPSLPASDQTDSVKSVYYLNIYQLMFHEVLVQAGLEDQTQNVTPSSYPISSRLQGQVFF